MKIDIESVKPAGFWIRVGACILDGIITTLLFMAGSMALMFLTPAEQLLAYAENNSIIMNLFIYGIYIFYYAGFESSKFQATPGKLATGLIVVEQNGEPIGPIRSALRYICKFLSAIILCIGFLMVAFTKKKVGLHDIITSSRVVYKPKA